MNAIISATNFPLMLDSDSKMAHLSCRWNHEVYMTDITWWGKKYENESTENLGSWIDGCIVKNF